MRNPFLQDHLAVPRTPVPTKRTAIPRGYKIVAEVFVVADCPLTPVLFTTRHVEALDDADAGRASASAATRLTIVRPNGYLPSTAASRL